MKFSVVIPNYTKDISRLTVLEACLQSFLKFHQNSPELNEIIISDDGSPVECRPALARLAEKYKAILVQRESNGGFGVNANAGLKKVSPDSDIILLINNDVIFTEPVLSQFMQSFDHDKSIGIVGCLLFYPDGTIQHAGVVRNGTMFSHIGWRKTVENVSEVLKPKFVIAVVGAIMGLRKAMLDDVGGFDENFYMCREDTQLCLRAWQKKWKVLYQPSLQAVHIEGATRGSSLFGKVFGGLQTRKWFVQELKTEAIFMKWLKKVNLEELDQKIVEANSQLRAENKKENFEIKLTTSNTNNSKTRDLLMSFSILRNIRKKMAFVKNRIFNWLAEHL